MLPNYVIRYSKRDGSPTLTYFIECRSDESAIAHMRTLLGIECDRAEVWRDGQLVHVERKSELDAASSRAWRSSSEAIAR